jgi:vacuolar protein sorting-associated protein 13A/C
MLPLKVMVLPEVLNRVFAFFKVSADELETMSGIRNAAQSALQGVTAQTRAGLEFAIQEHTTFELRIGIDAPILFFPTTSGPLLVVDAGHLQVKSEMIDRKKSNSNEEALSAKSFDMLVGLIYDKFLFELSCLSVKLMITPGVCDRIS